MFIEKKRKGVSPRPFTSNGTLDGVVTVSDISDFFVKQEVMIQSNTQQPIQAEIKRFISPTSFYVGPKGPINQRTNLVNFTLLEGASISAPEQDRPGIKPDEIERAVYAEEPIVAKRVIMVDEFGNYYNEENPLPFSATFTGDVNISSDGFDLTNPDSNLMTGSEDGTKTGIKHAARIDSALDLRVGISSGNNKAGVNNLGELSVVDSAARTSLSSILAALSGSLSTSDTTTHSLLTTVIAGLVSIDNGIPAALGQDVMANSMPVTLASDQPPIPVLASLGDEPIKISGTEDGQPNGTEFTFVNNRLQQILKAKDRQGTISYADFGTKNQRIVEIQYLAPSIGAGPGFTAKKEFTYTLIGTKYRRDTPGNWSLV